MPSPFDILSHTKKKKNISYQFKSNEKSSYLCSNNVNHDEGENALKSNQESNKISKKQ